MAKFPPLLPSLFRGRVANLRQGEGEGRVSHGQLGAFGPFYVEMTWAHLDFFILGPGLAFESSFALQYHVMSTRLQRMHRQLTQLSWDPKLKEISLQMREGHQIRCGKKETLVETRYL